MKSFFIKLVLFIFGAGLIIALEILLLESMGMRPRGGLGWIAIPILFGLCCARLYPAMMSPEVISERTKKVVLMPSVLWIFFVGSYVLVFDPYNSMYDDDYIHMLKVMLFPPFVLGVVYWVYNSFISKSDNVDKDH